MAWFQLKQFISLYSGLSMDALHAYGGVLGQIAVALLLKRTVASPWPWLVVLAATLVNEWSDLTFDIWPDRAMQYEESVRDVWNTMLLPTVLLLVARFLPQLLREPGQTAQTEQSPAS